MANADIPRPVDHRRLTSRHPSPVTLAPQCYDSAIAAIGRAAAERGGVATTFEAANGKQNLLDRLRNDGVEHLWVAYSDYNGRTQGKSLPRSRFESSLRKGITFAQANLGHNVLDSGAPDTQFGADSGDFFAVPDPTAYAPLPLFPATGRVYCWMRQEGGAPWDGDPRWLLQRQVDALAELGFTAQAAFEPEGYLFRVDADGNPAPAEPRGMFTLDGLETNAALLHRISDALEAMDVRLEQIATEYGPGQFEVNICHADPIKAADNLLTVRDITRAIARQEGLVASFMPKPFESAAGSGLHVHLSLWDRNGTNAMELGEGESHASGLSAAGRAFLGGLLRHAPALSGIGAPTVNSYKRLQPGTWAPAHAAYAVANRSSFVRIPGSARPRIEVRSGDNTSNPYIYLTALLAAGIEGIRQEVDPGSPAEGDLGHMSEEETVARGIAMLPRTAPAALAAVEADPLLREALGPIVASEWLKVKRSEIALYDTTVSPWERTAYLRT
jgi:glutamine synthetase